ncbi:hypothetical protein V6N13_025684 [Hibiscus sabdariffa]
MVELVSESEHSGVSNPGALPLSDFPPLGAGVAAATSEAVTVASTVFAGDVGHVGKVDVVAEVEVAAAGESVPALPPQEVIDLGARQWDNALLGKFLGKSSPLSVFQRILNKFWGVLESGPWHVQQKALILRRRLPGMMPEVFTFDKAPIWVKLWHVPLELYSQQGLGYLASALGKPLYTDRSTAMKLTLEYAKVCVEVSATYDLLSTITVDLGNSTYVDVGVQLDWAPPCCSSWGVFGHVTDKCRKTVVQEGAKSVGASYEISAGVVGEIGFDVGAKASSCPVIVDPVGDVGLCVRSESVPSSNHGGVIIPNKFDALCDVVEEKFQVATMRPCRVAATSVADLMEKLKPKEKLNKKNGKGKGRGKQKDSKDGCSPSC